MHVKSLTIAAVGILWTGGWVLAREATEPVFESYVGEVTVKTLNLRSGPSTNYYVVTRLPEGARVRVVGEESGWLTVEPPRGCYSLIAAEYVDRGDGVNGVVNANRVRVRAGSDLSSHSYAVQLKLNRGALVKILGQADEQFLKIAPPAGANLWVSDEYIRRVSGDLPDAATESAVPEPVDKRAMVPESLDDQEAVAEVFDRPLGFDSAFPVGGSVPPGEGKPGTAPGGVIAESEATAAPPQPRVIPADEYRAKLDTLDAELKAEMDKPLLHRDFATLLPRYRELAEQEVDTYTQAYAGVRIRQIEAANDMVEGLRRVRQLRDDIRTMRKTALSDRADLRPVPVRIEGGFDAEGELRPSALYNSPVGPRRYRLVDPASAPLRTLGYVEIPPESDIDVTDYLGRRVGVRASERVLQTGEVDLIAIYVASELVVLDRPEDELRKAPTAIEKTATAVKH